MITEHLALIVVVIPVVSVVTLLAGVYVFVNIQGNNEAIDKLIEETHRVDRLEAEQDRMRQRHGQDMKRVLQRNNELSQEVSALFDRTEWHCASIKVLSKQLIELNKD